MPTSTSIVMVTSYGVILRNPLVMIINSYKSFPLTVSVLLIGPVPLIVPPARLRILYYVSPLSYDSSMTQTFQGHQLCFFFPSTWCLVYDAPIFIVFYL